MTSRTPRSLRLLLVLVLAIVSCAEPLATARDGGSDAPTPTPDGDSHPIRDGSFPRTDTQPVDAARDDVSPLSAAVRVIVRDLSHAPVADSPVWFHDASGAVLQRLLTDGDGVAVSGRAGIAAITVRLPPGASPSPTGFAQLDYPSGLYSLWGVELGDTITFDLPVAVRRVSALAFGTGDHLLTTAVGSTETMNPVEGVWDSIAQPGILAYGTMPDTSGAIPYVVALGGSSTEVLHLETAEHALDTIPIQIVHAPPHTTFTGWGAVGSDVGMLRMTLLPATPVTVLDHLAFVRGLAPGPTSYLAVTATDDRGASRRDYDVVVPYDHAIDASGRTFDLSAITAIDSLAIDHDTLEVSWGTVVDADLVALTIATGSLEWHVVATGSLDRLGPPGVSEVIGGAPLGTPGTVYAQCAVTFERRAASHDYAAFRAHPLGPFDSAGWAGTRTRVWDQPF